MTYRPPFVLPEREEVVGCALAAVEIFTAPVVDPRMTVWLRVVQDGNAVLHRNPNRSCALADDTPGKARSG